MGLQSFLVVTIASLMLIPVLFSNPNQVNKNTDDLKYRIIVFGWKRRASLRRLLDSLESADYLNWTDIPLEIFLDGDAHELVVDLAQNFFWSHGELIIHQREKHIGLEKASQYTICKH